MCGRRRNLSIEKQLGGGIQGVVFSTHEGTAVKALIRPEFYARERDVYSRLKQARESKRLVGFNVPRLLDRHDELLVIEMQIVTLPYVLGFCEEVFILIRRRSLRASDPEIMVPWEAAKREQFEERWPTVKRVMSAFEAHGIYLSDIKPGNIEFGD